MNFIIFLFEGQFDSVFLPFIHQRPKFQANCQLWTAYKPNVSSSTGNTLPRLCKKCTKNGKSHVGLDPFPQKSSTAIVWYRINVQDFQGEVKLLFCRINFVKLKKFFKISARSAFLLCEMTNMAKFTNARPVAISPTLGLQGSP